MNERGAALLEVLIALALTALMAAALSGVTGFGLSALERAQSGSARMTDAMLERRNLTDALSRMTIVQGQASLIGTPESMIWRGMISDSDGTWVPTIMRLRARDMEMSSCADMDATDCEVMSTARNASATFSYAGPDGIWLPEWSDTALPALVRIATPESLIIASPRSTGGQR